MMEPRDELLDDHHWHRRVRRFGLVTIGYIISLVLLSVAPVLMAIRIRVWLEDPHLDARYLWVLLGYVVVGAVIYLPLSIILRRYLTEKALVRAWKDDRRPTPIIAPMLRDVVYRIVMWPLVIYWIYSSRRWIESHDGWVRKAGDNDVPPNYRNS